VVVWSCIEDGVVLLNSQVAPAGWPQCDNDEHNEFWCNRKIAESVFRILDGAITTNKTTKSALAIGGYTPPQSLIIGEDVVAPNIAAGANAETTSKDTVCNLSFRLFPEEMHTERSCNAWGKPFDYNAVKMYPSKRTGTRTNLVSLFGTHVPTRQMWFCLVDDRHKVAHARQKGNLTRHSIQIIARHTGCLNTFKLRCIRAIDVIHYQRRNVAINIRGRTETGREKYKDGNAFLFV
jgi:hypothetical protein